MQTEKNLLLGNVFAERRGTLLVPVQSPLPQRKIMHQLAMLAAKLGGCVNELFCSMCSFFQILGPFPIS